MLLPQRTSTYPRQTQFEATGSQADNKHKKFFFHVNLMLNVAGAELALHHRTNLHLQEQMNLSSQTGLVCRVGPRPRRTQENWQLTLRSQQNSSRTVSSLCLNIQGWCLISGMGPMPWTINSEIYPLWARSTGNACAAGVNWTFNILVSLTFLHLAQYFTYYGGLLHPLYDDQQEVYSCLTPCESPTFFFSPSNRLPWLLGQWC